MKRKVVLLIALIILALLHSACGSGGGDPSSGVPILPGGSVSGQLNVPPNNHLEAEPNDAVAQAQAVTLSSVVAGRASELDSGFQLPSGNQVQDLYRLTATESIRIVLTMAQNDHMNRSTCPAAGRRLSSTPTATSSAFINGRGNCLALD